MTVFSVTGRNVAIALTYANFCCNPRSQAGLNPLRLKTFNPFYRSRHACEVISISLLIAKNTVTILYIKSVLF